MGGPGAQLLAIKRITMSSEPVVNVKLDVDCPNEPGKLPCTLYFMSTATWAVTRSTTATSKSANSFVALWEATSGCKALIHLSTTFHFFSEMLCNSRPVQWCNFRSSAQAFSVAVLPHFSVSFGLSFRQVVVRTVTLFLS